MILDLLVQSQSVEELALSQVQCKHLETVPRDFRLQVFFHKSVSPKPLSIPLGTFQIFSKIYGDNNSSSCTTGLFTPVANGKSIKSEKLKFLVWTPLGSRVSIEIFFPSSSVQGVSSLILFQLFATSVDGPVVNLPPVLLVPVAKFAAGVFDNFSKLC